MPYSMTGIGFSEIQTEDYEIFVRIKSVNNKGIDISVKGSRDILFFIENEVRNFLKNYFSRGSFQVFIDVKYKNPEKILNIDVLEKAVDYVKNIMQKINLNPSDDKIYEISSSLMSSLEKEEPIDENLKENVFKALEKASEELKKERKKEGENLVKDIENRLNEIENLLEKIKQEKDNIIEKQKNKMIEKLKELLQEEYKERAFIETSIIAEKLDITEEIVRLESHLKRFRQLLKLDEPIGRKLDFLCQEMHREINTLGNKMPDFSKYTIEIKSEIEKIRQQVANIE